MVRGPGPCSRCAGLRLRAVTPATGAIQPYCRICFREYARERREAARAAEPRPCTTCAKFMRQPGSSYCKLCKNETSRISHERCRERARAKLDAAEALARKPSDAQRRVYAQDAAPVLGKGKRSHTEHRLLELETTPELVSLLDELVQLEMFGLTREAVALTLLRQRAEREIVFWGDRVRPVVATLK